MAFNWTALSPEQKISVARRSLITKSTVWWGSIALKMHLVRMTPMIMAKLGINTCAVDGTHFFYNPDFIDSLSKDDLTYVFAHEVMHLANLHHTRMGHREPGKWNEACDYVINQQLVEAGMKMPQNSGIINSRYLNAKYKGWSAERVYADLPDKPKQDQDKKNNDPGGMGGVVGPRDENGEAKAQSEYGAAEQQAGADVAAACKMAKDVGTLPGSFEEMFPEPTQPKVDWRQILPRFLQQHAGTPHDTTWSKPNRRHIANGLYLPAMEHRNECEIVVVMDTSGSMDTPEFAAAIAETNEIIEVLKCKVHFIQCDADIHEYKVLEDGEPLRSSLKGRGGTDFCPPFAFVEEKKINPHCLIYFTDLYGSAPPQAPKYPVLWACTTDQQGPWGETMKIELS
jgi:predicted metal-dependent peptidase